MKAPALALSLLGPCAACSGPSPSPAADLAAVSAPDAGPGPAWRLGAPAPEARTEVAAAPLGGRIYLVGGLAASGGTRRVDVYDPQADRWTAGPALPEAAPRHHLAIAADGARIYVLGGFIGSSFTPTARSWLLDGQAWREGAVQPLARGAATAQAIGGQVYVAGGALDGGKATAETYRYDPAADRWQRLAPMKVPREHVASCALGQRLFVSGGRADSADARAAEIYDVARDEWTRVADQPTARSGLGAAAIGDLCHVFGGERLDGQLPGTFAENEAFDLSRGVWLSAAPMPTRRHGLAAVAAQGAIYTLLGGPQAGYSYSDVVEIFTP